MDNINYTSQFRDESIYLLHNNMTNEECEILTSALDNAKKCQKYTTFFKRWNADNYSSCYYDIFENEVRIEWHE